MKKEQIAKKKRNFQDATLKNIRALKKRVKELESDVSLLQVAVGRIIKRIGPK